MQKEIIFSYNGSRCHAIIKNRLPENLDFETIGSINGYTVYKLKTIIFNQFDFVAIKSP